VLWCPRPSMPIPFWKSKSLRSMTRDEWESLCDGCGKCCLHKIEDDDGKVHLTVVACRLLDPATARCRDYENRKSLVPGCVRITPRNVRKLALPHSCAYRTLAEGRELPRWHPLVTGDPGSTRNAGRAVGPWVLSEEDVPEDELEEYVVASIDE